MLCELFTLSVNAQQTYEINVGDKETLYAPNPPQGTIDYGDWSCSNTNVWIYKNGRGESADVKIGGYFSGTATISCSVKYTWYDGSASAGNRYKSGYTSKTYTVVAKPTEVKLNKTSMELQVGEESVLSYSTSPSGLEPDVTWITSDKNIVFFDDHDADGNVKNKKSVTITAWKKGTAKITCQTNTGVTPPTCTITVKDDIPSLKADVPEGSIKKGTKVTLTCNKTGAEIYYTTDGSNPTKSSQKYVSPIVINESMTLKAIAYANGFESRILTQRYTVVAHDEGEVFTYKTIEGVSLTIKAFKYSNTIFLQVGIGKEGSPAVDKNYTGNVTIPGKIDNMTVRQIAEYAFDGCKISSITIPPDSEVMSFRFSPLSFRNCVNLTEISFSNCNIIAQEAFKNCDNLETIVFSRIIIFNNSMQANIMSNTASNVFPGCNGIRKIYSNYDNPYQINDDVFPSSVYTNATLYVPASALNKYKSTGGWKKFKNILAIGQEKEKLSLTASPNGGQISAGTTITLTARANGSTVSGCDIYYTTNGTTPSRNNGTKYSSGIIINSACTLKAIAYKSGYEDSDVLTATYTIKPDAKPKLVLSASPSGGQVSAGTTVTLTAKADGSTIYGCDIYYTTDGTTPSKSNGTKYSSGITINSACTLKAIAYKSGYEDSDALTEKYTIKNDIVYPTGIDVYPSTKAIKVGETFTATYSLTPSNATTTVTWSSDDSSIASVDSYTGKVTGKSTGTTYINATTANGKQDWCKVTIEPSTQPKLVLSASPSGGKVAAWSKVTLAAKANGSIVSGCDIYYTTDGSTPTKSSTKYTSSGITIYPACTLKAIAYKTGYETSDVLTANYAVELFLHASPSGGVVEKGTVVELYARDKDGNDLFADIYYTLNGSTPTKNSTPYTSSGITINSSCTLKAVAYNYDIVSSDVLTAKYTIASKPKLVVSASPTGGTVSAGTVVALTAKADGSTVYGCDIYYTTDGTTPSKSNGTKYSSGITINSACTLKAIAYKDEYETSDVLSMKYTIGYDPITITIPGSLYMKVNDTFFMLHSLRYKDRPLITPSLMWTSSNVNVVSVTEEGLLKAVGLGTSVITVKTSNGLSANCDVSVIEVPDNSEASVKQVFAVANYTYVLSSNKTLWRLGEDLSLSSIDVNLSSQPMPHHIMDDVAFVSASASHTMIIKNDGTLWAFGDNSYGQLGDGTPTSLATHAPKKIMDGVASVSAGSSHTMILKTDGTLWACGHNSFGQLGDGTTKHCPTPMKVMDGVASVSAGSSHTMILKTDGTLWACGHNSFGQLGDGTTTRCPTPMKVMDGVASVSAGSNYSMIIKADGTLWACGDNSYGQLCDGTKTNCTTPKKVMDSVASVMAGHSGYLYTMIIKTDGTLWACGYNYTGCLGDGTTTNQSIPKKVMDSVAAVSTGYYHTLFLKTDGTLWGCGFNLVGQLGDGTTVTRLTPVKMTVSLTVDPSETIAINTTNFPDVNFRNYLLGQSYGQDGMLMDSEITNIKSIKVDNKIIRNLKGIEFFVALEELFCTYNNLSTIDISNNTALKRLYCGNNQLKTLDISRNNKLINLSCHDNKLTVLDVSNNKALKTLSCYCNEIKNERMDVLINSLPENAPIMSFELIGPSNKEENVCTKKQVATAKSKGWTPLWWNGSQFVEYEGSDGDGLADVQIDRNTEPAFSLSGQRLAAPRKGLNIVGGKKILVK